MRFAFLFIWLLAAPFTFAQLSVQRLPREALAPQVATDSTGRIHLIYFKGDPSHGDIFYSHGTDQGEKFSQPLRVNSQPGSALVLGSVRSPQLAVGRDGRAYVAWNGSSVAEPKANTALPNKTPMLFARLNDAGTAFESQRNVITQHAGIDGGGSVAADDAGNVYVAWHAPRDTPGEIDRYVWIATSKDDGKTFAPEVAANTDPTGACGCCGLKITAQRDGTVPAAYRTATESIHRDMVLLSSTDFGQTFKPVATDPWQANACVMSTSAITGRVAAWETRGQIRYALIDQKEIGFIDVPGPGGDRKHPAVAVNMAGDFLIAWAEGTAWAKGGRVAWQLFDRTGRPTKAGVAEGLPVWSAPAAFAKRDGTFVVMY